MHVLLHTIAAAPANAEIASRRRRAVAGRNPNGSAFGSSHQTTATNKDMNIASKNVQKKKPSKKSKNVEQLAQGHMSAEDCAGVSRCH